VKKAWLFVALAALVGSAISTFADVQNIRLSGDIRIRGYYLINADGDDDEQLEGTDSYISQRTRVTVEADLEDHVLVVVTLKAEGLWGADNQTDDVEPGSGAGLADSESSDDLINRRWDVGVTEAYVQFNEMFYTAATLKLGKQYLHYGRGLIFSSVEQEYNYDAARLVLDFYPLTLDLVYALVEENSPFGHQDLGVSPNDIHVAFVNARYEMTDSAIKDIEMYFGWLINSQPLDAERRAPPSTGGGSPMIIGIRSDINLTENLETWVEGAYEWGPDGFAGSETISAWIANVGGRFTFKDAGMSPALNANLIWASGGGSDSENAFRPWFDYADGYNGYVFSPNLSNIIIINLGASVKPAENTTLSLQGYYYMSPDRDGSFLDGSNPNVDNGGIGPNPTASDKELGWEVDGIISYDYSKDVTLQLVYGVFIPGNRFSENDAYGARLIQEVRGEVNVRF